ncbi:MAG: DUF99 domain-containing protein [Deltaproteobacteria bacterium]|nr:MAG: DUF99 domain-containing protein [Deltaproteobacteria bacterium]
MPLTNVIGFDDGAFAPGHRGDVLLVGTVFSRTRLEGVLTSKVRRDGRNSTERMIALASGSRYQNHIRAVLLQGIAVAGFNVVDVHRLGAELDVPVLVVARKEPNFESLRRALGKVPGGTRKWRLMEAAGPMERLGPVWVQRIGLDRRAARQLLEATTLHGNLPEPLRVAHLIASGVTLGASTRRA